MILIAIDIILKLINLEVGVVLFCLTNCLLHSNMLINFWDLMVNGNAGFCNTHKLTVDLNVSPTSAYVLMYVNVNILLIITPMVSGLTDM